MDRFCILCAGWTGRKYREISRKIGKKIGDTNRNLAEAIFLKISLIFRMQPIFADFNRNLTKFSRRHFAPLFRIVGHRNRKFRRKKWKLSSMVMRLCVISDNISKFTKVYLITIIFINKIYNI